MPNNFEEYVDRLQKKIKKKDIKDHNEKIVNLFYNPQNWGKPPNSDITVFLERRGGPKNYFLGLYLKIVNNNIIKANFVTDGCGVMVATGSQLTILIKNKPINFAENLMPDDIDNALMGLPEEEKYCTHLAIETLKDLIKKYKQKELT
ncbi:MAG: iron-sulfur cluster assembly scaffold protein [Candidatus Lokiarchaeota archaeon]|nr:iron-sulfur cluster assembly scaffold protein [Candidatus Lokiarchaeota archaeon]